MRRIGIILTTTLGLAAAQAAADTVVLKNHDTLTGTITRVTPRAVTLATAYAGKVRLRRAAVQTLYSTHPVAIVNARGKVHRAALSENKNGTGWFEAPAGVRAGAKAAAAAVFPLAPKPSQKPLPEPRQVNLEPYFLPIGPHWKNRLTLGFANTTGNSDMTQFAGNLLFQYHKKPDKLSLGLTGLYGVSNGVKTQQLASSDNLYRHDIDGPRDHPEYLFAENHDLYDDIKGISFRTINSVGLGYYVVKSRRLNLDVRAGPGFTYEKLFDGTQYTDPDGLVGFRLKYHIDAHLTFSQEAYYTQSLINQSHYQINAETALEIKLPEVQRGLGVQFAFDDGYDNSPSAGHQRNDTRLTAGLTLDF